MRIPAVNFFPTSIAIVPADLGGDSDLSDTAAWKGFGPKSFWSRGGWREGGMGCSSAGFPAVLESQSGSVQCCPLLQALPITAELMYNMAVLREERDVQLVLQCILQTVLSTSGCFHLPDPDACPL